MQKKRYDRLIDPHDHISYFQTSMDLYGATNVAKCHIFPATLKGIAWTWFDLLPNQSINNFKQLHQVFMGNFAAHKRRIKNMGSLWVIVQREGESLRNYIKRLMSAYIDVKDLNDSHTVQIFIFELTKDHVWHSLTHENVSTIHKLVTHAHKFAKVDEMKEHYSHKAGQVEPW